MKHLSYRKDIDGLRAFAVLAVIIFHYFPKILRGGFVGVDVFFVISGFLISGIIFKSLDKKEFSFADFYSHRIRRILPALILTLSACIILGWFILLPGEYEKLGKNIVSSVLFATNIELYLENGYFDIASHSKPLLNLWSLGVEEQYYLIWPIIILFIYRFRINLLFSTLFLLLASLFFALKENDTFAFFMPHTRFWELAIGSLLAYIEIYKKQNFDNFLKRILFCNSDEKLQNIKSILGFVMIVLIMRHKSFSTIGVLFATLGSFLIISSGKNAWINHKILSNKILVYIGLISYPLYLWHWPLIVFLHLYKTNSTYLDNLAVLALSFGLAWLTYEFVEKKIRYKKEKLIPAALLVIFSFVGLIGYFIYYKQGLQNRFSKEMAPIFRLKANKQEMRYEKCFLNDKNQNSSAFSKDCVEKGDKKLIFLWGDSHAAHLYPGLVNLQKENPIFRIAQFNVGSCPPILGNNFQYLGNKFCKENNDYIFREIILLKPNTVILSFSLSALIYKDLAELGDTIKLLKKHNVKVILIGTMPLYEAYRGSGDFMKLIVKLYKNDDKIPYRNKIGLSDLSKEEGLLRKIAQQNDAIYISMIDLLCNEEGCLLKTANEDDADLITYDGGHLSNAGSDFVIKKISGELISHVSR